MSSLDPQSTPPSQPSPPPSKRTDRRLVFLACAMGAAFVLALGVPQILYYVFLNEAENARKQKPLVGTRTDVKPPPGVSTDPYAGASRPAAKQDEGQAASPQKDEDK